MNNKKPEPNVYFDNKETLMQGLDNMREMSPEEIVEYRKKIDATRIAQPRKAKAKKEESRTIE